MTRSRRSKVEAVAGALAFLLTASSANAVMVSLVPNNASIPTVGGSTVVNVNIANVTGVESLGFNITYTAAIASVSMVQQSALTEDCAPLSVTIDNVAGRVTILAPCPVMPISGSGTLFSITFNGSTLGTTPLAFTTFIVNGSVRIPNGCLLNEGTPSCEPSNGTLSVGQAPTNTATVTASRTNTLTPPPTVTLTRTRTGTSTNTPTGVINTPTRTNTSAPGTATASATSTVPATNTRTRTNTATVTNTPTSGPSGTPTNTALAPSTATATLTPPASLTASVTLTPALTATITNTVTAAPTGTVTATGTVTNTAAPSSTRPGIPVIPSPMSAGGIVLISGLAVALLWALQRLQRPQ